MPERVTCSRKLGIQATANGPKTTDAAATSVLQHCKITDEYTPAGVAVVPWRGVLLTKRV